MTVSTWQGPSIHCFIQINGGYTKGNEWIVTDSAFLFNPARYAEIIETTAAGMMFRSAGLPTLSGKNRPGRVGQWGHDLPGKPLAHHL